jgi:diketogulonate reductase-like aldo/keto reductase
MRAVSLPSGEKVPSFGLGTWQLGDDPKRRAEEIATLRLGLDLGARLIDTAEMYGDGRSESLVGEAIQGRREEVFLVSKVYPHNASRKGSSAACERSLRRLKTERLDLYLLHWRGQIPLEETLAGFVELQRAGKIRYYGVSNLDLADMQEVWSAPGGSGVATDQVLYNLARRGIEWDLQPWLRERRIPVMAYSPIEQSRLLRQTKLVTFSKQHAMTPAQAALAWLLSHEDVIVIPKSGNRERLKENFAATERSLSDAELAELDRLYPPPTRAHGLEML